MDEAIDELYHAGFPIKQAEHPSGFPAITIDVADLAVLTDTISAEVWHHAHSKEHLGKEDAEMDRDEAIKRIRAGLKKRTDKPWSVTHGRGTV